MTNLRLLVQMTTLSLCASLLCIAGCASGGGTASGGSDGGDKAAVKGSFAFWPIAPDEPRIQFIRSLRGSADVSETKPSGLETLVFGKEGQQDSEIVKPYGVAMAAGKIYVCDMRGAALVVLDIAKKQTRLLGSSGGNKLTHPVGVAVAPDGMIYVADNERGAIVVFDQQERYSDAMGFPKFKPVAVAVSGDKVYACDSANQSVVIFDRKTGKQVGTFGKVGDGDGEFRLPMGIAADKQGNIYVADTMRCRVQKFSPNGTYLAGVGSQGDTAGSFARPKHIAVDSDGILYVVDAAFQNVQMFDDQLRLLMAFGSVGNFPGCMDLPAGVAVCDDSTGLFTGSIHPGFAAKRVVVVTNQFGDNKVSVYAMGGLAKGYSTADLVKSSVEVSAGVGTEPEILKIQQALQNQGAVAAPGTERGTPAPAGGPAAGPAPATTQTAPATGASTPPAGARKPTPAPAPAQASPR